MTTRKKPALPDEAMPDAPDAAPPAATPPAPIAWVRVRYDAPRYGETPVEAAGQWWHNGTMHVIPATAAGLLDAAFTVLGPADRPVTATP